MCLCHHDPCSLLFVMSQNFRKPPWMVAWFCFIFLPSRNFRWRNITTMLSQNLCLKFLSLPTATFEVSDGKSLCRLARDINSSGEIINPKTLIIKPNASSQQLWISRLASSMEIFKIRSCENPVLAHFPDVLPSRNLPVFNKHCNHCKCCPVSSFLLSFSPFEVLNCQKCKFF